MLKIRLARVGKKKKPIYRLVVSEHTKDMYGDHLENLGQYNPHTKETVLKNDRIEHWLKVGAQPSETVHNLLVKEGLMENGQKAKAVRITKKRKAKMEGKKAEVEVKKEEKKEEAPAEPKEEDKTEEAKAEPTEEKKEETKEDALAEAENKEEKPTAEGPEQSRGEEKSPSAEEATDDKK